MIIKNSPVVVFLQARMSSKRFPGKVMKEINGKPMIAWQIQRILQSTMISEVVVLTSTDNSDDILVDYLESIGVAVFRGSLEDVHSRFLEAIKIYEPRIFIRVTGDCPLVMSNIIDEMINRFRLEMPEYMSSALKPTFPDGLDVEIVSSDAFLRLNEYQLSLEEREHATLGIWKRPLEFRLESFENVVDLSGERWTVDYPEDLEFVRRIFGHMEGKEATFLLEDVLELLSTHRDIRNSLSGELRNIALKETE
jgi:spore coat polysaccharide biosynthesis protein SpsF